MIFFRKINLYRMTWFLLAMNVCLIALADELDCGRANIWNSPKLAVVSADKVYFYDMVFDKLLPTGWTTHLAKRSFEGKHAYLVRGDEVVVKESSAGYAESNGQCFVSYIDRKGKLTSGFLDKSSLKLLSTATTVFTADDSWWQGIFLLKGEGRFAIKKDIAEYEVVRGGKYAGEVLSFQFDIVSRFATAFDLRGVNDNDHCNLKLWRLHHYLYVQDLGSHCGGMDYRLERLLRRQE